jgi:hypothetical protein
MVIENALRGERLADSLVNFLIQRPVYRVRDLTKTLKFSKTNAKTPEIFSKVRPENFTNPL